ncbi:MAG TPA: DUF2461 domain-containing protein [Acidimicrobiia bacterium]|nr:DUF2461 domain-containing protein [Acidimicrobiia bacterium]
MSFRGWKAEAIEFYEGLEADNSRRYWQAHTAEFEELVRAPMVELVADLEPEFGAGKIFRPYRDTRFSADKSPYKTRIYAAFEGGGYVQLSAEGLGVGCGYYFMDRDQLDRYRRAVADDAAGTKLRAVVDRIRRSGIEVTARESLRTVPRGYPRDHPRADLLRCKGLITWKEWEPGPWLGSRRALDRIVRFLRTSAPLVAWLDAEVGA